MDVLLFAQLTIVCILCNFGGNATPCQGVAWVAFQKQSPEIAKRVRKMARIGLNRLKNFRNEKFLFQYETFCVLNFVIRAKVYTFTADIIAKLNLVTNIHNIYIKY